MTNAPAYGGRAVKRALSLLAATVCLFDRRPVGVALSFSGR
jgi:hypothetical protein